MFTGFSFGGTVRGFGGAFVGAFADFTGAFFFGGIAEARVFRVWVWMEDGAAAGEMSGGEEEVLGEKMYIFGMYG
jgi:hypothetical protein